MPCWAWLASESAEMPSELRVDRAWELAASSLRSALVRLAAPVSRMLARFLVKSWRFCTTVRFEPKVEDWLRRVDEALVSWLSAVLMSSLLAKPR